MRWGEGVPRVGGQRSASLPLLVCIAFRRSSFPLSQVLDGCTQKAPGRLKCDRQALMFSVFSALFTTISLSTLSSAIFMHEAYGLDDPSINPAAVKYEVHSYMLPRNPSLPSFRILASPVPDGKEPRWHGSACGWSMMRVVYWVMRRGDQRGAGESAYLLPNSPA